MQLNVVLHIVFIQKQQLLNQLELGNIHITLNTVYLIESSKKIAEAYFPS